MKDRDLRSILSRNIRAARSARQLTQAKLAEKANISLPYMSDIEYCKTWVSDKTLQSLAKALNMNAYELLVPPEAEILPREAAKLLDSKKEELKTAADMVLEDLAAQILKLYMKSPEAGGSKP
ncbi:MAG: helix-turn-helix domain-containing protein [Treponema sp.]|nr:helix-turn-helix domain-containing protein [Treponema sp.]